MRSKPPPFDLTDFSQRAERIADQLRKTDSYRDDIWNDRHLGPLVRVYALLTHRPEDAFEEAVTPDAPRNAGRTPNCSLPTCTTG